MNWKSEPTHCANIFLAGDFQTAKHACRRYCLEVGLCITVTETEFVYTGGSESGVIVGLVNYPRFPTTPEKLKEMAKDLATYLMDACCQHSVMVMTPDSTEWLSRRDNA